MTRYKQMLPYNIYLPRKQSDITFPDQQILRIPIMKKKKLDLYKVFTLVVQKGGATKVTTRRLWLTTVSELGFPTKGGNRLSTTLRYQ